MNSRKTGVKVGSLALVILASLLLGACASAGGPVVAGPWTTLTPAEAQEAQITVQAMDRMAARCQQDQGRPCARLKLVVVNRGSFPQYQPTQNIISLPRQLLVPEGRAVIAHELSHAYFSDARDNCRTEARAEQCEQAANLHGIQVLMIGYGYDQTEAMNMMWRSLVALVEAHVKPAHGHPDMCRELHAYERSVGQQPLYACQEA